MYYPFGPMLAAISFILQIYMIICIIRVALSWLGGTNENALLSFLSTVTYALTEPVFATVRRAMPSMGDFPLDLAPAVVIFGIYLIQLVIS